MKTFNFPKTVLAVLAGAMLAMTVAAQNSAPQLAYGVPQILQLVQAKVSDDTIIAYIHNSGNSYGLNADQIIYLRQQGVSDNVLNVMLTQPKPASYAPAPSAPPPDNSYTAQTPATYTPAPAPTYVASAPSTVYVMPNSQAYYNYPYYYPYYSSPYYYGGSYYPSVSLSFAWGSGGGYHGGYYGGYYGGGYHGGYPGYPSGGYHPPGGGGYPGGGGHPPSGGGGMGGGGHPPGGGGGGMHH